MPISEVCVTLFSFYGNFIADQIIMLAKINLKLNYYRLHQLHRLVAAQAKPSHGLIFLKPSQTESVSNLKPSWIDSIGLVRLGSARLELNNTSYDDNDFSKKLSFFLQYRFDIVTASPQLLRRYHHDIYLKEYLIDTVSISLWWRWFFKKIKFFLQYRFGIVTASSQLLQRYYHDIYLKKYLIDTVSIACPYCVPGWWRSCGVAKIAKKPIF